MDKEVLHTLLSLTDTERGQPIPGKLEDIRPCMLKSAIAASHPGFSTMRQQVALKRLGEKHLLNVSFIAFRSFGCLRLELKFLCSVIVFLPAELVKDLK
ncbi:hypothetical protein ACH5RR_023509 [Cinchona calisaya]|uniref:Uncharacterized protein n=1 Tax=Cinchona calisaya TaxID=153742 RepID=A0ABD2ZE09_9GENT